MLDIKNDLSQYILADGYDQIPNLKKCQNSWFIDSTGKRYLDCFSQFASQALGWNNPDLLKELSNIDISLFANKIANSDIYLPEYLNFVKSINSITNNFKYYFFIDGGALAVENALKTSFDWKAQKMNVYDSYNDFNIISFKQAFHGRSGYTLSITNTTRDKIQWFPRFNWSVVDNPKITYPLNKEEIQNQEYEVLNQIKAIIRSKKNTAAVIIEPIQGEGGDNHFRKEFLKELRKLTLEEECLLIFDEVQTGYGATGSWWCCNQFGITPDILIFGKKVQTCGICCTNRIDEAQNNVFKVSSRINSTWGGNIVDMIRSTITTKIIKEQNILNNVKEVGSYLLTKLKELELPNARGRGLIVAFDRNNKQERDDFYNKLSEKVLCLKCGDNGIRLRPHLTFTKENVDYLINCIKNLL